MMAARGLNLTVFPGHIGLVRSLLRFWPWAALASSLLMLGVAHAFETFGRLAPCELCLKEREVYWVAATLALVGGVLTFPASPAVRGDRAALTDLALAMVFLGGTILAAYHAGVEWKFWPGPASCTGGQVQVSAADLARLLHGGPIAVPQCDKPAWVFLGISMAGWNALISLKLTVLSVLAAWFAPRKVSAR